MNMNNTYEVNWTTKTAVNTYVTVGLLMVVLSMFAPMFLSIAEDQLNLKYARFIHKDALVKEEMGKYKIFSWGLCIISWTVFIVLLNTINYC